MNIIHLNEAELETIIGGTALPSFFDQFRNAKGKIVYAKGTLQNGKFVHFKGSVTTVLTPRGDSIEGLTKLLHLQKSSGCTHVALGTSGKVFSINNILAKL